MSGILDVWTTVFRSDTDQLDEGLEHSERNSQKLADKLVDVDKGAAKAGSSFKAFAGSALAALTGALSVGALITDAVNRAAEIGALAATSNALNVAIEDLDAFGKAAEAAGGDAQGARDSLTDMAEKIGEAFTDAESGAAKAFAALKIGIKDAKGEAKDALTGILDLAGAVEGLSKSEAVFKIKELGITDNRTVEMVLKGRKELERMLVVQKEQGVVTKENAEVAARFTEAMNKLNRSLDSLGLGISTTLMPALTVAVNWLQKMVAWAADNQDVLVGFFGAIAAIVTAVYLPAMIRAAAATLAATWPILAIIVAVGALAAAFALAYDDVMNFVKGNDSLIGQIFEKYPHVKKQVEDLASAAKDVWAAFKFMGNLILELFNYLGERFSQFVGIVVNGSKQIASGVQKVANFFGVGEEEPAGAPPKQGPSVSRERAPGRDEDVPMVTDGSPVAAGVPKRAPGRDEDVPMVTDGSPPSKPATAPTARPYATAQESVAKGQQSLRAASASPLNATTSNTIQNTAVNNRRDLTVSIGEVNVETKATDAKGVADGITPALGDSLKQLESEFATGRER